MFSRLFSPAAAGAPQPDRRVPFGSRQSESICSAEGETDVCSAPTRVVLVNELVGGVMMGQLADMPE